MKSIRNRLNFVATGLLTSLVVGGAAMGQAGSSNPLDDGLVIRYAFDGNFADSSGNVRNPTQKDVVLTEDRVGRAASACYFNGTSSYLSLASVPEPTDNAYSWSVWIRTDALNATNGIEGVQLIERTRDFGINELSPRLFVGFNGAVSLISCCVNDTLQTSGGRITVGQWIHVAVTSQKIVGSNVANRQVYINGQVAGSDVVTKYGQTGFGFMIIGADRFKNSGSYFQGAMDDLRIYSRELTALEINQLYMGPDCNGDGVVDYGQIQSGALADTNNNGVLDVCELVITSVQPISGASTGGTAVRINGNNFPSSPIVTFGGVSATDIVRVSPSLITAVTPAGTPGMTIVAVNSASSESFYYGPLCDGDLDNNGTIDSSDLGLLLINMGDCSSSLTTQQEPMIFQSVETPTPLLLNKK